MPKFNILVASYTNSIVTLEFDSDAASLLATASLDVGHHPSWIAGHPKDTSLVVTGLEQADGRIVTIRYDLANGKGSVVSEAPSGGQDPCSLLVDATDNEVLVANYSSGNIYVAPISTQEPFVSQFGYSVGFSGSGPDKARQADGPHPHQVIFHPEYPELLVPDLGVDVVRRLKRDATTKQWTPAGHIGFELGGGPRHVAFHDGDLFTLLELSSKVVRHRLPPLPQLPKFIASAATLSSPPPKPHDMIAAEIHIPKPNATFPTAYLYISNRNDPSPEGDSISIFAIDDPEAPLTLIAEVRTGLKHVRGMEFFGPHSRYLIAGGGRGGGVKVFERVDGGRGLKAVAESATVEAPTGFLILQEYST